MKHLNQTVARMDRILAEIDDQIDRLPNTGASTPVLTAGRSTETKRMLQERIVELRSVIDELRRPALTDADRRDVLNRILDGLSGFHDAEASKLAATEYTEEWFKREPDRELARLLAKELLNRYPSAGLGAPSVWSHYAEMSNV